MAHNWRVSKPYFHDDMFLSYCGSSLKEWVQGAYYDVITKKWSELRRCKCLGKISHASFYHFMGLWRHMKVCENPFRGWKFSEIDKSGSSQSLQRKWCNMARSDHPWSFVSFQNNLFQEKDFSRVYATCVLYYITEVAWFIEEDDLNFPGNLLHEIPARLKVCSIWSTTPVTC